MAITEFFALSKVTFIKDEVEKHGSEIDKTEWDSYFNWYFEGSKPYQEHHIASYQHIIFQLKKVRKQLQTQKRASEAYSSPPPPSLSIVARKPPCAQAPRPKPPSSVLSLLHLHAHSILLLHLPFPLKFPLLPSLLNPLKSAPLKLSLLKI